MATTYRYVRKMLTMQTAVLLRPQLASGQLNTRKLPIDIQFCVKMQSMSSDNGVDLMVVFADDNFAWANARLICWECNETTWKSNERMQNSHVYWRRRVQFSPMVDL